jgi:hypothetical protein
LFSGAATFSFDNTLAESQDLGDIIIDDSAQMLPHTLASVAGSRPVTALEGEFIIRMMDTDVLHPVSVTIEAEVLGWILGLTHFYKYKVNIFLYLF